MKTIGLVIEQDGTYIDQVEFSSESPVTLGRADENKLVLESSSVSRNHGLLSFNGDQWQIEDLKSTNGIEIDGKKITKGIVSNSSIISIRPFTLTVILPEPEEPVKETMVEDDEDRTIVDDGTLISDSEDAAALGGATFLDSQFTAGGSSQDYLLVLKGLNAGQTMPLFENTVIGQSSSCDMVFKDDGVADEHVRIVRELRNYSFEKLAEKVTLQLNGKNVVKGRITNGDILKIGHVEVKTRFAGQSGKGAPARFLGKGTRIAVLVILLITILGGIVFFLKEEGVEVEQNVASSQGAQHSQNYQNEQGKNDGKGNQLYDGNQELRKQQGTSNDTTDNLSLDEKRKLERFVYQAKQYLKAEDYTKAINRLEAALVVDPENIAVSQLLEESRDRVIEKQKAKQHKAQEREEYKNEAEIKLTLAEELTNRGDFTAAIEEIALLQERIDQFPDLTLFATRIKELKIKIDQQRFAYKLDIERKKEKFEQQLEKARKDYEKGVDAYQAGSYQEARKFWEQVVQSEINIPERERANTNLDKLNRLLSQKIDKHLERANASLRKKDYPTALFHLHQVLGLDPEQSTAKATYDELFHVQLKLAQHYYREGLVYEGINNTARAIQNWREVLKVLPLEDSDYFIKAKKKLTDYGVRL